MSKNPQYKLILCIFLFVSLASFGLTDIQQEADSLHTVLEQKEQSEQQEAIIYYQLGLNYYRLQKYVEAIEYTEKALVIFKKHQEDRKVGQAIEQIGIYYAEFSDYQKSIEYLLDALRIAEEAKDDRAIHSRNFNLGTTFIEAGNHSKGILYLKKALAYYQKHSQENKAFLLAVYSNLGVGFKSISQDSAMHYYRKAIDFANTHQQTAHLGAPLLNMGEIYQSQNEIQKAQDAFLKALDAFQKAQDQRGFWHAKFGIASIYAVQAKPAEAIHALEEVQAHFISTNDLEYLKKTYEVLSQVYEQQADYTQALYYKKQLSSVKDSIASAKIINKINDLDLHYRIEKLQTENRNQLQLLQHQQKIKNLYWYMATGFLLLIIILTISRYQRKKSQKRLVETELRNSELEKQQLSNELEFRNKELESFALHIVQKNDLLQEVKQSLKRIKKAPADKSISEINDLNLKLNQALKINKELEKFRERVDEVNSQFFDLLSQRFPTLTEKEKRLCALLKLNLSSKEIASLNDITEGAVTMARYRLRKKLGLNNEDNLIAFFQSIS